MFISITNITKGVTKSFTLYFLFTVCLLFFVIQSNAQSALGSWNVVNLKYTQNSKWSFFGEAQLRSLRFYNHFHYFEFKGGATYKVDKNFSVTAGIGDYNTYSEGGNFKAPLLNDEVRTWLQVNMSQQVKKWSIDHRYRAEQRFTAAGYRNRFRYRLGTSLPINKQTMQIGAFYLQSNYEIFFTNRSPYFERTRFYIGSGYVMNEKSTIQIGLLNQFDYKLNDETGRNFFQLSWLIDIKKKKAVRSDNHLYD